MNPANPEKHPPHHGRTNIEYFLPGQILLHLEHPKGLSRADLAKKVDDFLKQRAQDKLWSQLAAPAPEAILSFPPKSGETAFSIVPTPMANPQGSLVDLVVELAKQLMEKSISLSADEIGSTTLISVSPHWLMGGAYHGCASGGPGGWPKKATKPESSWPKFVFPEIGEYDPDDDNRGEGVHVAILDTAPCLHELLDAYENLSADHDLIESLLAPGGPLHVHPASHKDLLEVMDYSASGHRYRMVDHGLFVAGIIHTITRKATLHLYEVLNAYGIGSLATVAQGLLNVLDNPEIGRPLIVNCSLVLGVSKDGQADPDLPEQLRDPKLLEHMRISLEDIIKLLDEQKVIVVAAAGNDAPLKDASDKPKKDASGNSIRPAARFPAAFPTVIGVGAAPKDFSTALLPSGRRKTASYSNLADDSPKVGYVTLGGEEGVGKGVQGVYIHEFPQTSQHSERDPKIVPEEIEYKPNDSGWAWWSGTSFATPIVSGLLAASGSANLNLPIVARIFLDNSAHEQTGANEKVIIVDQGP